MNQIPLPLTDEPRTLQHINSTPDEKLMYAVSVVWQSFDRAIKAAKSKDEKQELNDLRRQFIDVVTEDKPIPLY